MAERGLNNEANEPTPPRPESYNDVFETILSSLELNELMRQSYVEVTTAKMFAANEQEDSYDIVESLSLKDLQLLAVITTSVRNGVSYPAKVERFDLTQQTIEAIKGWHEGDTSLTDILFRR